MFDPLDAGIDETLDLLGCIGTAPCQVAHLASDHGKAPTLLARASRLNGSVQSEDVGLEGDAVNGADDLGNLLAAVMDLFHSLNDLADDLSAALCYRAGTDRQLAGKLSVLGVLSRGASHLLHGGGGFFKYSGLLFCPAGQVCVA